MFLVDMNRHTVLSLIVLHLLRTVNGVDQVSEWSQFSECSASCGGGYMVRSRTCFVPNTCTVLLDESSICNYHICPQDGEWTDWSSWGMCTLSCGGGTKSRSRTCNGPFNGGVDCVGEDAEQITCNTEHCPIDGTWGEWSSFDECTTTCGGGLEIRTRECTEPQYNGRACIGDSVNSRSCNTDACPGVVDGNWGPWNLFGGCSATCNEGTVRRERSCTNPPPSDGGLTCPGSSFEEQTCNDGPCPIDGSWNWWGEWSACSTSCYDGVIEGWEVRYRLCDAPEPQYGGDNCTGSQSGDVFEDSDPRRCNTDPCPTIDGEWGSWSDITLCSKTCGGGMMIRTRNCDNPAPQNGGRLCPVADEPLSDQETRYVTCNVNPCPVHGLWASWSNYSECTQTCGDGYYVRTRTCTEPEPAFGGAYCAGSDTDSYPCDGLEECTVDGQWSEWSEIGECSVTCGGGTRERTRQCDNPPRSGDGLPCEGHNTETFPCGNQSCPAVDGAWSQWGEWSECTAECDGGMHTRIRACNEPAPSHGGLDCVGYSTQASVCNTDACPEVDIVIDGRWSTWTSWTECTATCGGGMNIRERTCSNPPPSPTGRACDLSGYVSRERELLICNRELCPVDGQWSSWTTWGTCSRSCNTGLTSRSRRCDNPYPSAGGANCIGAVQFSDTETQTIQCNQIDCSLITTLIPPSSTTSGLSISSSSTTERPMCPREEAWEGLYWESVPGGSIYSIVCPTGATGIATRQCEGSGTWATEDTSGCISENVGDLQNTANNAQNNATAREEALQQFQSTCNYDSINLAGDLLSCKQILHSLIVMDFFGDVRATSAEKTDFLDKLLQGLDGMIDLSTRDLWQNIVTDEENDDASAVAELTYDVENLGLQVAKWLSEDGSDSRCQLFTNFEFCVERLYCDTSSYRQPKEPVAATPPPYHTRGGWVSPPLPNVTYVSIPDSVARSDDCGVAGRAVPMKYAVTTVFDHMLFFLPDEFKNPVIRDDEFILMPERDVPMDDTLVVNSKVISSTIYVQLLPNSSIPNYSYGLPEPIQLHFHANKTGRDPVCVFLDLTNLRTLYNSSGCRPIEVNINHTVCTCDHMTTFALLMKLGDDGRYNEKDRTPDGMLLFACIINVILLTLVIIAYFIVGVFKKDRFFILINMWLGLILAHFMAMTGGYPGTRNEHACKFVVFVIQCAALAAFMWFVLMAVMIYTQLKDPVPLGRWKMILYFIVGWATPFLATVFTMALNYEAYGRTDEVFCWISWIDGAPLGFAIPEVIMVVAILLFLFMSERFVRKKLRVDEGSQASVKSLVEDNVDYGRLQSYIYKLLAFLLILCLAWAFFALLNDITVVFFLLDIASIVFVVLVFCILDPEVQQGFKARRQEWRYNKIKKEKEKKEEQKPEWIRTMQSERNYMRSLEERNIYGERTLYEQDVITPRATQHTQPAKPKYVYTG